MKRILWLVPALLLSLFLVTACPKPGCLVEEKLITIATDTVSDKLQCRNKAEVQKDLGAIIKGLGLCKSAQTGPIADIVCPVMVKSVVDKLVGATVPATWQCSAENAKATIIPFLTEACRKLPVSE